jgi:exodeoxyribonuclease V alpha subunit
MTRAVHDTEASGGLAPIDLALARMIERLAASDDGVTLGRTAALVSRERRSGHPCIELARWAERPLVEGDADSTLPSLRDWRRALEASALVGDGGSPTPLVLDSAGRCYLHRYWAAERRVAARASEAAALSSMSSARSTQALVKLFPTPAAGKADRQAEAARAVLRAKLTLVSGGPGTGKTTTIARVIAILLAHDDALEIALAAPTGKAAARLTESLREQAARLDLAPAMRERIGALEARTIHRLLGFSARTGGYRYDATHTLPCDVLIVDEASMVDLLAMDAIFSALPERARLVLVGDKDQLASVDAGFVFGDLCDAAPTSALRDCAVELDVSWRFREQLGIAALAAAVRAGDGKRALAALDGKRPDARLVPLEKDPTKIVDALASAVDAVVDAATAEDALAALSGFRLLTPLRLGPHGVESLNRLVERGIADRGHAKSGEWYVGRPVLVTRNDYDVELYNGDVGVAFPDETGTLKVWFRAAGGLRAFGTGRRPPHETAWAMTVHKSQGSELDDVVFVLPERDSPLLTRELVYTAVTRARKSVTIYGEAATLVAAVERKSERVSGLRDLLASP